MLVSDADDSDGAYGTNDSVGKVDGLKCYVIIEGFESGENTTVVGNGELETFYSTYADTTAEFYKVGDASNSYNCLGYAMKDSPPYDFEMSGQSWTVGENDLYKKFPNHTLHYNYLPSSVSNCVIAYGTQYAVHHYAKMQNGVITAKLGNYELVQHPRYDIYHHVLYSDKLLVLVNPSVAQ